MILLGSTDVCSIICHVVHDHSVDHIAGVQLSKSDDDDEGLCWALSLSLPLWNVDQTRQICGQWWWKMMIVIICWTESWSRHLAPNSKRLRERLKRQRVYYTLRQNFQRWISYKPNLIILQDPNTYFYRQNLSGRS